MHFRDVFGALPAMTRHAPRSREGHRSLDRALVRLQRSLPDIVSADAMCAGDGVVIHARSDMLHPERHSDVREWGSVFGTRPPRRSSGDFTGPIERPPRPGSMILPGDISTTATGTPARAVGPARTNVRRTGRGDLTAEGDRGECNARNRMHVLARARDRHVVAFASFDSTVFVRPMVRFYRPSNSQNAKITICKLLPPSTPSSVHFTMSRSPTASSPVCKRSAQRVT